MSNKKSSKDIREEALAQIRKTKARINKEYPGMLKALRQLVAVMERQNTPSEAKALKNKPADKSKPIVQKQKPAEMVAEQGDDYVQIDRAKNIETVLKFASQNTLSDKMKKEIDGFLN